MFPFDARYRPAFEAAPSAPAPVYRSRSDASPPPTPRWRTDPEACLILALVALGCAPSALSGLSRGGSISAEVTICAFLFVTSLTLLVRELAPLPLGRTHQRGDEG